LKETNLQRVLHELRSGRVCFLWLAIPCSSWSRARRNDGRGPGPLRDDGDCLWGFDHLEGKDLARAQEANRLVKNSCRIIREAIKLHIPWVVENPQKSRLWLTPQMQRFTRQGAFYNEVHFCQFGEKWRKATFLLAWNLSDFACIVRICGGLPGICSRTGDRHINLSGRDASGAWLTRVAQPYPRSLCYSIASKVISSLLNFQPTG